jgi:hypothetical protein
MTDGCTLDYVQSFTVIGAILLAMLYGYYWGRSNTKGG